MTTTDWRHHASCRSHDPETWFPIGDGPAAKLQTAEAKKICWDERAVRDECLQYALATKQDAGVWGGLDEYERAELTGTPAPKADDQIDETTVIELAPCGTNIAYKRHVRRGEPIDQSCRDAHNAAIASRHISPREREAIAALADGLTPTEIATAFGVGRNTVHGYLSRSRRFFDVQDNRQLITAAQAVGILDTPGQAVAA